MQCNGKHIHSIVYQSRFCLENGFGKCGKQQQKKGRKRDNKKKTLLGVGLRKIPTKKEEKFTEP